jgi:tripartite ATP-independent transporter DctP family solute receptor
MNFTEGLRLLLKEIGVDKKAVSFFAVGICTGVVISTALFSLFIRDMKRAGTEDKIVLKLAHALDTAHPVHKGMVRLSERMRELSGGTVEIQIFPSGQLGGETQCLEQLQHGALDMAKVSTGPLESFIPEMTVFSLPYVFRDEDHYWQVLEGPIGERMLLVGAGVGLHGICYFDAGARSFYTVSKPILTPDDLKGLKIRVQKSETAMEMIKIFGGSPTPISWGELYTSLQQKVVDGAENNPPSFYTNRHFEVCKHFSLTEHTRTPDILMMSQSTWEKLPAQVQDWFKVASAEAVTYQKQLWKEETAKSLTLSQEKGVKIYHPDLALFKEKAKVMCSKYDGKIGETIKQIEAVQ